MIRQRSGEGRGSMNCAGQLGKSTCETTREGSQYLVPQSAFQPATPVQATLTPLEVPSEPPHWNLRRRADGRKPSDNYRVVRELTLSGSPAQTFLRVHFVRFRPHREGRGERDSWSSEVLVPPSASTTRRMGSETNEFTLSSIPSSVPSRQAGSGCSSPRKFPPTFSMQA